MKCLIDGKCIPKFINELTIPKIFIPQILKDNTGCRITGFYYYVTASQFKQQILPKGFPPTTVWGYGGTVIDPITKKKYCNYRSYPGPTFESARGIPTYVKWINKLNCSHVLPVDPTLHWADPNNIGMITPDKVPPFPPGLKNAQYPIPMVPHLHGGETCSIFDGHPDAWFTANNKKIGSQFATSLYQYTNCQPSTMLWYHDHTLGITRLNVYMGLAGLYFIRDKHNKLDIPGCILPPKKFEIPLVIQDATFNKDGSLYFPNVGNNPNIHPYWQPEFFGNAIVVNGKTWPNLNVIQGVYRFRILNACNSRFLNLKFSNGMSFVQIGSDGGYLSRPVTLKSALIAPAERIDILVNFQYVKEGEKIIIENDANIKFPTGSKPDKQTTGQIMQLTVKKPKSSFVVNLPQRLNCIPKLIPDRPRRILTLVEVPGENGPEMMLLDGQRWSAPITEKPIVGSTELWEIVNISPDSHPIHLHLVQFLIKNSQKFDLKRYTDDWTRINGMPPLNSPTRVVSPDSYLQDEPIMPPKNEQGWKDTVKANPGEVTRILVRYAPIDVKTGGVKAGINLYPFNPEVGPGYVWHCHMLSHEDNEMMRPLIITSGKNGEHM